MPIDTCSPCNCLSGAYTTELGFRAALLNILCAQYALQNPSSTELLRINGNYNGTNQVVLAAPGAGYKIKVRSLYAQTESSDTDARFGSGDAATDPISPNLNFLSNAGAVLPMNADGWFETDENEALVITTNNPVDLLGTAVKVPV